MALDAIYASDLRKINPIDLLASAATEQLNRQNQDEIVGYAKEIVQGVIEHNVEIDDRISDLSRTWDLDRMPAVDRAILRIATWELLYNEAVPDAVVISEAVQLAKDLSTEASGGFVNGILGAIAATKRAK